MIKPFLAPIWTLVRKDPRDLARENLALRQQLAVYKRLHPRPPLQPTDRLFWIWLSKLWTGWRESLIIVKPQTVIGWHRTGCKLFWTKISQRKSVGRRGVSPELRALISNMAEANLTWGAPRLHGEAAQAGHPRLRTNSLAADAQAHEAAFSELENIPRQPLARAGRNRLLHRCDCHVARAVCAGRTLV